MNDYCQVRHADYCECALQANHEGPHRAIMDSPCGTQFLVVEFTAAKERGQGITGRCDEPECCREWAHFGRCVTQDELLLINSMSLEESKAVIRYIINGMRGALT